MPNITLSATAQNVGRLKSAILSTNFTQNDLESDSDFIKRWITMFAVSTVYNYETKQATKNVTPDNSLIT